jgi:hypothetical protein
MMGQVYIQAVFVRRRDTLGPLGMDLTFDVDAAFALDDIQMDEGMDLTFDVEAVYDIANI